MKICNLGLAAIVLGSLCLSPLQAATDWSTQDYDLYPGDFDGDGKTDLLYVAKDPAKASGIAKSDANGAPNTPWQSWPSNYLGIPWDGNQYSVHVADFSGDGKADIFLQRNTPGDNFLLVTTANGKITATYQTVPHSYLGLYWSTDQHKIVVGDFSGDGKADLFLQPTSAAGIGAVVLADSNGQFTSGPQQSWGDGSWGAFKWSTQNSNIFAGDFNGDGKSDLLIQAKPYIVMVDYEIPIPVATFQPNSFGVVLSQGGTTPFQQAGVQQWSRNSNGVDWSPNSAVIVVGNFDGAGGSDVLLQSRTSSRPSYLLTGSASGAVFSSATSVSANVAITADAARLIAGNFDGIGGTGVYVQTTVGSANNYIANTVGSSISASYHSPAGPTGALPATTVGSTAGSFAVTNEGHATYTIPISAPAGVNGMTPQLALEYDSTRGNGLMGVGWAITGLPAVARCNKTIAQDGEIAVPTTAMTDVFCVDGNRLRLTSGSSYGAPETQYRTEQETFQRFTAKEWATSASGSGPRWFKSEGRDGLYYEYGGTADSRIASSNGPVLIWALSKVADRSGNSVSFAYLQNSTVDNYRPSEIAYAHANGSPTLKIKFVYESRPDPVPGYFAGRKMTQANRLDRLDIELNGGLVRRYELSYQAGDTTGRSRLASVQECTTTECLPPTNFFWSVDTAGWGAEASTGITPSDLKYALSGDMNGDGRDDLAYFDIAADRWKVLFGAANGFNPSPSNTGFGGGAYYQQAIAGDIDGDGKRDILVRGTSGLSTSWWWLRENAAHTWLFTDTNIPADGANGDAWLSDITGDGLDDLFWKANTYTVNWRKLTQPGVFAASQVAFTTTYAFATTSYGSNPNAMRPLLRIGDFNGDSARDLIVPEIDGYTSALVTGGNSYSSILEMYIPAGVGVANLNGDRYSDYYILGGTWRVAPATGGTPYMTEYDTQQASNSVGTFNTDWDGDGRADLLAHNTATGHWDYLRSIGEHSLSAPTSTGIPATGATSSPKFMDINGDGLQDLVYVDGAGVLKYRLHAGRKPDLLSGVSDGLGNSVSFNIQPLPAANGCYERQAALPAFPKRAFTEALYVTCSVTASNGSGGFYTVSHKYYDANTDLQGRGFLGFERHDIVDGRDNVTRKETYSQTFPHIGALSSAVTVQADQTKKVSEESYTLASHLYGSGASSRALPYVSQSVVNNYEVSASASYNGTHITTVSKVNTVDTWGTLVDQVTTITEKATGNYPNGIHTQRIYHPAVTNDETNWCLGKPTQSQQTHSHTLPSGAQITRTTYHAWDPVKCRLLQETLEPSNTKWEVITDYTYDSFGNIHTVKVTPVGQPSRTTTIEWEEDAGRFPDSIKNPLGQETTIAWDLALGVRKSLTDPNGITTYWDYDVFRRLFKERRPDGTATQIDYAPCTSGCGLAPAGKVQMTVSEKNNTSQAVFGQRVIVLDAFGRERRSSSYQLSGALTEILTEYTDKGAVSRISTPHLAGSGAYEWNSFSYDLLNRPTQSSRPRTSDSDASAWSTTTLYEGLTVKQTDALNRQTSQKLSALGQIVQAFDAAGYDTEYEYDAFGNLKITRDHNGNQIELGYNVRGMKMSSDDPDMGHWTYDYSPLGELIEQKDANHQGGAGVTFTYDPLGRMLSRTEPEGSTYWVWGTSAAAKNIGRLDHIDSPGDYHEVYSYDAIGRVADLTITAAGAGYTLSYGYSSVHGAPATLTYPASTGSTPFKVQYDYAYDADPTNKSGRLKRVKDFNAPSTVFWTASGSDSFGQVTNVMLGNGLNTSRTFDSITGQLNAIETGPGPGGGNSVQRLAYTWDKVGNLSQRKDVNQNVWEDAVYDNLYRLDVLKLNGTQTLNVDYDAIGNISVKSDVSSSTWTYHATKKHAVTAAGSNTYGYDANGNMTSRNGAATTWYSYNLPNTINQTGGNYSQFSYGAHRQRYQQVNNAGGTIETTIYIGGVFEKVTRGGVTEYKHYIAAEDSTIAVLNRKSTGTNETVYPLNDHLGSTDKITSSAGSVLASLSYDAFGKRRGSNWAGLPSAGDTSTIGNTTHDGYTGHEHLDNLSLIHMNGRVFDPTIGRFMSADPFVQAPYFSQSLNRYSYGFNNPLTFTDPTGFCNDPNDGCSDTILIGSWIGVSDSLGSLNPRSGGRANTPIVLGPMQEQGSADSTVGGTCLNGNGACHMTPLPPVDIDWSGVANDWWPGYQVGTCIYEGCSGGNWILGAIGAWPGGKAVTGTSLLARGALSTTAKNLLRVAATDIWRARMGRSAAEMGLEVHHRIPLEWAHLFPSSNPNAAANLLGVAPEIHWQITAAWNEWRVSLGRAPTAMDVEGVARTIDAAFSDVITALP